MSVFNSVKASIITRNDTAANLALINPVLARGELCAEIDTNKLKIGDGFNAYNDLEYIVGQTVISEGMFRFVGVATTEIENGSAANPQISGYDFSLKRVGDVIFYGSKEFVWADDQWNQIGDENIVINNNIIDLVQNPGDVLVLDCGSASNVL